MRAGTAWLPIPEKGAVHMRRIVATEYVSLDGIMEEPGQWSFPFWSEEAARFKYDELFASDALLLGRLTYEGFARAWPTMTGTGEFGERMNGLPKYVVSTTLDAAEWNNSHLIKGDVPQAVAELKQQPGRDILLAGSGVLLRTLMQHDLVDEYRLMVHPIILGSGRRLFGDEGERKALRLVETRTFGSGVVVLRYEPAANRAE
jgi:dihydrofolate reductase